MLSYITLGAADLKQAVAFYDAVIGPLGWKQFAEHLGFIGYGPEGSDDGQTLWLCHPFDGQPARAGNGVMVAFSAKTHDQVHAFHAAALAHGGTDEGPPGPRPHYGPTWYAAYLRDPTGNKLAIVCDAAV